MSFLDLDWARHPSKVGKSFNAYVVDDPPKNGTSQTDASPGRGGASYSASLTG